MNKFFIVTAFTTTCALTAIAASEFTVASNSAQNEIKTTSPYRETITKSAVATGRIVPRKEVEVKSQVSGVVEQLFVKRGDQVKRGDAIARIELVPDAEHLNSALVAAELAEQRYLRSSKELQKHQVLFSKNLISETALGQYQLQNAIHKEELLSAQNNVNLIKGRESNNEVNLSNIVVATSDGTVLDIPVKEGFYITKTNTFSDGTTLAYIADMSDLIFEGLVDEFEVGALQAQMAMQVKVAVFAAQHFSASLENVSLRGEWDQGVIKYRVEADMEENDQFLFRSGYSANAEIILARRENTLAINEGDIIFENGATFVDVVDHNGKLERKAIVTGLSNGLSVEVLDGLNDNSRIRDL